MHHEDVILRVHGDADGGAEQLVRGERLGPHEVHAELWCLRALGLRGSDFGRTGRFRRRRLGARLGAQGKPDHRQGAERRSGRTRDAGR